jgi:exopolyphosphatase / guanosine-5'-triphosphate,3'-diphosphate pyrophosphatase
MRAAIIDIGSSHLQLLIGERDGESIRILESLRNIVPVGAHAFLRGRISQEIINQTIDLLEKYKRIIKEYDVLDVRVIATTAVREARNKDIFLDTVLLKTGFRVEVLNVGDVVYYIDAFLSHRLKKTFPIHDKNLFIAELGAGSLDISVMEKGYALMSVGFPVGTLRLKQFKSRIDASLEETNEAMQEYIENQILYIKAMIPKMKIDDVILVDESYSVFLQNILPNKKREADFIQFTQGEAEELLARLSGRNTDDVAGSYNIPAETADTLDGYAMIVNMLFKLSRKKHIYIFETSLAEAALANILFSFEQSQENNKVEQLVAGAKFLCQRYDLDLQHSEQVAGISQTLFDGLKDYLGLKEKDRIYLLLAGYLHDIGMFVNNRSHHKHTEYVVSALNLFRLTEEEARIIACVCRYHRKAPPANTHPLYNSLVTDRQILVQKLSALLRIANALDGSHKQKAKQCEVTVSKNDDVTITVHTDKSFVLERTFFADKKGLFEEITGNKISLSVKEIN